MLQRIQTLYFLGAMALVIAGFFMPMAEITTATSMNGTFTLMGLKQIHTTNNINIPLLSLSVIIGIILFGNIFKYKNRKSQMKVSVFVIIMLVILIGLIIFQFIQLKMYPGIIIQYKLPLIFPLISIVLIYLGYKGIKKDEELVRSYDRIR